MKRALLFGIDSYANFRPLTSCVNDVKALEPLLSLNEDESPNFSVLRRTSESKQITRSTLLDDVGSLLAGGADLALLYFAGHGDVAQNDLHLATTDGVAGDAGVAFSRILSMVQTSSVPEVIVILDCCFSGGAGAIPLLGSESAVIRKGLTILTASRADQHSSATVDGQGLFSFYLCGALEGGAADVLGKVTVAGLYSYLTESFGAGQQKPMFKTHLDRLHEVRKCEPMVPLSDLRRITEFFPKADDPYPLDPTYEPTTKPNHELHSAIFYILQKYRANKLLEPIGTPHMYYAAVESKACRLTRLGRHYWNLVFAGRV